jgi:hypothetical protein
MAYMPAIFLHKQGFYVAVDTILKPYTSISAIINMMWNLYRVFITVNNCKSYGLFHAY